MCVCVGVCVYVRVCNILTTVLSRHTFQIRMLVLSVKNLCAINVDLARPPKLCYSKLDKCT
jgi:hypothetical protein